MVVHSSLATKSQARWYCEVMQNKGVDGLDLPRLTTLTTEEYACATTIQAEENLAFHNPHHITLESGSFTFDLKRRCSPYYCVGASPCIQVQEWCRCARKSSRDRFLTNSHWSSSAVFQLVTITSLCPTHPPSKLTLLPFTHK